MLLGMNLFKSHEWLQAIWKVLIHPFTTKSSHKNLYSKVRGPMAQVINTEGRELNPAT